MVSAPITFYHPVTNSDALSICYFSLSALTQEGQTRGFAHVEFSSVDTAKDVLEADAKAPFYLADRDLNFDFAPEKVVIVNEPHHKLYIYEFGGDEKALASAFAEYSEHIVGTHMGEYIHSSHVA